VLFINLAMEYKLYRNRQAVRESTISSSTEKLIYRRYLLSLWIKRRVKGGIIA